MLDNKTKERIAQEAVAHAYAIEDNDLRNYSEQSYIAGAEAEATRAAPLIYLLEALLADRNLSIPGGMMSNESVKQIRKALTNYNNPVNK